MIEFSLQSLLITGVLNPTRIQVKHLLLNREDTMTFVEVGIGEILVVGEELILEMTEANHVIASPVLIEELTATLIIDFLKGWLTGNFRSTGILTNLVEEILGTTHRAVWPGLYHSERHGRSWKRAS